MPPLNLHEAEPLTREPEAGEVQPVDVVAGTSVQGSESAADLANCKLKREVEKLDREIRRLDLDFAEARRPYIMRNPQALTAAIATLGAVIGISVAIYKDYYGYLRDQAKFASDQATVNLDKARTAQDKATAAQAAADIAQRGAYKQIADAASISKKAEERRTFAEAPTTGRDQT